MNGRKYLMHTVVLSYSTYFTFNLSILNVIKTLSPSGVLSLSASPNSSVYLGHDNELKLLNDVRAHMQQVCVRVCVCVWTILFNMITL